MTKYKFLTYFVYVSYGKSNGSDFLDEYVRTKSSQDDLHGLMQI